MSDDAVEDFYTLIDKSAELPEGSAARFALIEQAIELADAHQDESLGWEGRQQLIHAAAFGGRPDLMIVAFSWCLAKADEKPEEYDPGELLWQYKWVLGNIDEFPHVSIGQIDAMLADMGRRYLAAGSTCQVLQLKQMEIAMSRGDWPAADEAYRQMRRLPRDFLSDCHACELDQYVEYLGQKQRDHEALQEAVPLLQGKMRCSEVPHRTYARLLYPALRLGRVDEAMTWHQKGYRLVAKNPEFLKQHALHLEFMILTDNLAEAAKLVQRHLGEALASPALIRKFSFLLAARLFCQVLQSQGETAAKLRLPDTIPVPAERRQYSLAALETWLTDELHALARLFDERNGNQHFHQQMESHAEVLRWRTPCPLPSRTRRKPAE